MTHLSQFLVSKPYIFLPFICWFRVVCVGRKAEFCGGNLAMLFLAEDSSRSVLKFFGIFLLFSFLFCSEVSFVLSQ